MIRIAAVETQEEKNASAKDSAAMLISIGIVAYAASMMTHEALGHGIFCIAAGGQNVLLGSLGERCSFQPRGIEVAGPAVQFASGLIAWFALRNLRPHHALLRHFLWLYMVFGLLVSSGYVAFSGVTDFGDAAVLIAGREPHTLWRGALVLFGAWIYFLSMRATASELRCVEGKDGVGRRIRRLIWIPYLSAGVLACCASALNRTMPASLALGLAAASSFGAGCGMVAMPRLRRRMAIQTLPPVEYIEWNVAWAISATAVAASFIFLLGPGLG
jgi:hypothetical protein